MQVIRNAVFVDAGYVYGQGGVSLSGASAPRQQLELNEAEIINQLKSIASAGGMALLRIYWYDGTRGGLTVEHSTLADMPDVKLRLGFINSAGQQKGVDSLIVTDLIDLARNQAIADAYIVTGDGDMRIAVQIAQSFGVRVHLITLEPSGVSLNPQLRQEADTLHEVSKLDVGRFLKLRPIQSGAIAIQASAQPLNSLEAAAKQAITSVFSTVSPSDLQKLRNSVNASTGIPQEYDRKVLGTCRALLKRDLSGDERRGMGEFSWNGFSSHRLRLPTSPT